MTEDSLHSALDIRDLAKCFDRPAVDGLDLQVRAGEFYTLLGPNGAGKTTTLRMATGLLKPDRGAISVFGIDVLADPVAKKQMLELGIEAKASSPEELRARLRGDIEKWSGVIARAGIPKQ